MLWESDKRLTIVMFRFLGQPSDPRDIKITDDTRFATNEVKNEEL